MTAPSKNSIPARCWDVARAGVDGLLIAALCLIAALAAVAIAIIAATGLLVASPVIGAVYLIRRA